MPDAGPTSERLEALRARWEAEPDSRVFLQLADEYRRLGRTEEAARVLEEGLAANPHHLAAQVALGRCRLDLGAPDEAAGLLERVVESDPTQMVAYRLLVEAYLRQGRAEEARQRLRIYSLLNDADPEIAELRRRIGEIDRQPAAAADPEPAPAEPAAAPASASPR
ncbi:MAG TPA: tetratricopeptide repeat protein, partial [Thermoanaerobaculia bacterium]|nr:tetratricopeptide repeat protein [Thermoanaerobaculia bacterium]